jgi:hypothetical protein
MPKKQVLPRARGVSELVLEELPDELLVYDTRRHRAHCLNRSAALVFRRCDGRTTIDEMATVLKQEGVPGGADVVEFALVELARANLLEADAPAARRPPSRRSVLKRIGFIAGASLALPLIKSIIAPSVAEAASCGGVFQPCCGGANGTCTQPFTCQGGTCQ